MLSKIRCEVVILYVLYNPLLLENENYIGFSLFKGVYGLVQVLHTYFLTLIKSIVPEISFSEYFIGCDSQWRCFNSGMVWCVVYQESKIVTSM